MKGCGMKELKPVGSTVLWCIALPICLSTLLMGKYAVAQVAEAPIKDLQDVSHGSYKTDPYIHAAAKLQSLPKYKAYEALSTFAKDRKQNKKVIVLCRMLFTAKRDGDFRAARIGVPGLLGDTEDEDWPLQPIDLVDGVPFLIAVGFEGSGIPESGESYLDYCINNCAWSNSAFTPRSIAEKQKALEKLLASSKWKAELNKVEKAFLASQIK
jgi:hypothetical protein